MQISDVSPTIQNTSVADGQSVSGRALCVATSSDGSRSYLGGHSGVWRSDDRGAHWLHLEWPQPQPGVTVVPGCLPVATIFDLALSPASAATVLAAAGRDARVPAQSGIYRSIDAGSTWTRVHTFLQTGSVGMASRLAFAPDNPALIYAAGQFAIAVSSNGGVNWTESVPSFNQTFWHVVAGPAEGAQRRVYAVGDSGVWYSTDGGSTWKAGGGSGPTLGVPSDGLGVSSRALSINPLNPAIVYILDGARVLHKGDFTAFATAGAALWTILPKIPRGPGRTPSGATYVVAHAGPSGQLCLIAGDQERVYLAEGEPATADAWIWIDQTHHADPHGLAVTPDFEFGANAASAKGLVYAINDGGVNISSDGGRSWTHGSGLATLDVVNVSIGARAGKPPAICFGTGDNEGFYTSDGGSSWKTQEYLGGDNDCNFTDPQQPNRLLVFGPRDKPSSIHLYTTAAGQVPNGALGTGDKHFVPGPPGVRVRPDGGKWGWNAVSWWFNLGYRPLVLTAPGESPETDGDFVTILFLENTSVLLRTISLSQITSTDDWITTATAEGPGVKVYQQGPTLPDLNASVVQASGGHGATVFYVSDPEVGVGGQQRLWKWSAGLPAWQLLVPGNQASAGSAPQLAQRFFVDPYRPNLLYILDANHLRRSDNGGANWVVDSSLEKCLTENGAFPFISVNDGSAQPVLLRDMNFDPDNPYYRFAVGPAGVFYTTDGANWDHLLLSSASAVQPTNSTYDKVSDFCNRALYVATSNRGLLRLSPLPPDWDFPIESVQEVSGRIQFLRINDVGTGFGPPDDSIDAEVIFQLDTEPGKSFGFQLRNDANKLVRRGMLNLLHRAYAKNIPVMIDFKRESCRNGIVIRVALL